MIQRMTQVLIIFFCFTLIQNSKATTDEQHLSVTMRMIGHQVLLNAGDSTSRVLAIEQEANQYIINFESEFAFLPDSLIPTISTIMETAQINNGYIVAVRDNQSNSIIYNYEVGKSGQASLLPCGIRQQPKSDYSILITMLDVPIIKSRIPENTAFSSSVNLKYFGFAIGLVFLAFLLFALFSKTKKTNPSHNNDPNIIPIGDSRYDKRNMKLQIKKQNIELTHKEAELLLLLNTSVNTPLERETILKKVWGDEGDYVGRTLDVYVSKLRKKIELDTSLKIVNIRGVGYKLVVNA